jgi:hypothetical protein
MLDIEYLGGPYNGERRHLPIPPPDFDGSSFLRLEYAALMDISGTVGVVAYVVTIDPVNRWRQLEGLPLIAKLVEDDGPCWS